MSTLLALALVLSSPTDLLPQEQTIEAAQPQVASKFRISSTDPDGGLTQDGDAIHVSSTVGDIKEPWRNQIIIRTTGPIQKGDVLLLTVPLGLVGTGGDAIEPGVGRVKVNLTWEPAEGENKEGLKYDEVSFRGGMAEYHTPIIAGVDVPEGEGRVALHFSRQQQELRVGTVRLRNYGPDFPLSELPKNEITYQGREPDAPWRAEAARRIEKHRTGPITVEVVDADGNPVEGAFVSAKLQSHAFGWGAAVRYPLLGAADDEFPVSLWTSEEWSKDDAEQYRATVERLFNKVVYEAACRPNVWPELHNPEVSSYPKLAYRRQAQFRRSLEWLKTRGIQIRGHYLSWGAIDHPPQTEYVGRPEAHWAYQTRIASQHPIQLAGLVDEWDALNHPCGWGVTMEELHGGLSLHVETMRLARQAAPEGTLLYVNEGHVLQERSQIPNYERIIRHLVDEGVGPDGIGFMAHFSDKTLTGMDDAYAIFERFAPLADHLQLTELDISSAQDEQLHADYLRDIMTLSYSHPKMAGVVQWGFWEKAHWKPETALFTADWTAKPAAKEWDRLVNDQWHTDEQARTGSDGRVSFAGCHHGDYEIYSETEAKTSWQIVKDATGEEVIRITLYRDKQGE